MFQLTMAFECCDMVPISSREEKKMCKLVITWHFSSNKMHTTTNNHRKIAYHNWIYQSLAWNICIYMNLCSKMICHSVNCSVNNCNELNVKQHKLHQMWYVDGLYLSKNGSTFKWNFLFVFFPGFYSFTVYGSNQHYSIWYGINWKYVFANSCAGSPSSDQYNFG